MHRLQIQLLLGLDANEAHDSASDRFRDFINELLLP
jgi:hypothetical protein